MKSTRRKAPNKGPHTKIVLPGQYGFLMVTRGAMSHWLYPDHEDFGVWIKILLRANFTDRAQELSNGVVIPVARGSFVSSIRGLSKDLSWGVTKTRNFISTLIRSGELWQEKVNYHETLYTLLNYEKWQNLASDVPTYSGHETPTNVPTKIDADSSESHQPQGDPFKSEPTNVPTYQPTPPSTSAPGADLDIPKKERRKEKNIPAFRDFYNKYPRRVKEDQALLVWNTMTPDEKILAVEAIKVQKAEKHLGRNKKYMDFPATWLKEKRWKEEVTMLIDEDPWDKFRKKED